MKVRLLSVVASILIGLCGCTNGTETSSNGINTNNGWIGFGFGHWTKVININGHEYIILYGMSSSDIIHSGSCQCNIKNKKGE